MISSARRAAPVVALLALALGCGRSSGAFATSGASELGTWHASLRLNRTAWKPGDALVVKTDLQLTRLHLDRLALAGFPADHVAMLVTAVRTFDADGWLRFSNALGMSTLLTPTGLAIEGGSSGAATDRFGSPFKSPLDVMVEVPVQKLSEGMAGLTASFAAKATLPTDLPPGLYRLRVDFGVKAGDRYADLNGSGFASRSSTAQPSHLHSPLYPASGRRVSGEEVDAGAIQPRIPWVLFAGYNSNGYQGVVADEDRGRFALSPRHIIPDEVVLPLYDDDGNPVSYPLEPTFAADAVDAPGVDWDWTRGELSLEITAPDGTVSVEPATPIVDKDWTGPTTRKPAFTSWRPPAYGAYTVRLTGWIADKTGRRHQGGGTYRFWIAKRMTMATATFQGMPYPVNAKYGRDIAFSPPVPADVEVTATLYPGSDPAQATSVTSSGKATRGGIFGAAQGLNQLPLTVPGEYHGRIFAKYTDEEGHLWVCVMRHAGIVYSLDSPIVARGKKLYIDGEPVDRGETHREGGEAVHFQRQLEHIGFPYNPGDVLLIAADGQGANKIEPALIYETKGETAPWDWRLDGLGTTNLSVRTSNGYSPHLYPEYITEMSYYYASAARPGFMPRFLVGETSVFAPYWPTSPNSFGDQIAASPNGDMPGDIYRLMGGVVLRAADKVPAYAGYIASAFILPRGSNNNRVVAPGSEDLNGSTGEKARFFLVGFRPGMALELGGTWRPAFQVDPILPVALHVVVTYPDGRQMVADGVSDAFGSWAGPTAYPLDAPGIYRYQVNATWEGHAGKMPGLPDSGGEFYVFQRDRPAGAAGLLVDLPNQSRFSPSGKLTVKGRSSADTVRYALIMPGAVLSQGEVPVVAGQFQVVVDPVALNRTAPIYDIRSISSGEPQLGRVLHLTLFAEERAPDGARYFDFRRVVVRGTTVLSTR